MLVPKVAMRHPTAGPTLSPMVARPAFTAAMRSSMLAEGVSSRRAMR